jgi:nuclear pore complex protein Nup93
VERSLKHILDAGHTLLGRSGGSGAADAKASILLGSRGVDLPAIASKLGAIKDANLIAESDATAHTDIPAFLKAEREEAILGLLEETKRETVERLQARHWEAVAREWELDKARILSAVAGGGGADMAELSLAREVSQVSRVHDSTLAGASALSQPELLYARAVVDYNTTVAAGGVRPDLLANFAGLWSEEKEQEVWSLWEMAACMGSLPKDRPPGEVVTRARGNLEATYSRFIRRTVFDNLSSAQLGGVPGTYPLVRSFLNIKVPPTTPGLDDGLVDGVPVWAMIYYCLRCGDMAAARQAAERAGPGLADALSLLQELQLAPDRRLSPQTEGAVRLQYRRAVRQSTDPYKRAVYCVVAACDPAEEHPEVATSLDDYLWLKLCCVREEVMVDREGAGIGSKASPPGRRLPEPGRSPDPPDRGVRRVPLQRRGPAAPLLSGT